MNTESAHAVPSPNCPETLSVTGNVPGDVKTCVRLADVGPVGATDTTEVPPSPQFIVAVKLAGPAKTL
jgi:hypothetical protein